MGRVKDKRTATDKFLYVCYKFAEIYLFTVKVMPEHIRILDEYCDPCSKAVNYTFRPPFNNELESVLEEIKIVSCITKGLENYLGFSASRIANESFKHFAEAKIVIV